MRGKLRVIIVGGGIIGASLAYHLAKDGAHVTMFAPGGPKGVATPRSFAWINASWGNPGHYYNLRRVSMQRWRELARELPGLPLSWTGGLLWDLPEVELKAYVHEHARWGYGVSLVDEREAGRIEPALKERPTLAAFCDEEGAAEPISSTLMLVRAAEAKGARLIDASVASIEPRGGRAVGVTAEQGSEPADVVIVAAGAATPALLSSVGESIPLDTPPGLLIHTKPLPPIMRRIVNAPDIHVRQTLDGALVAGADFGGSPVDGDPEAEAERLIVRLRALIRGAEEAVLDHFTVGYRPTPADGFSVVGWMPKLQGLYVAVTHSGITLAPAIGELAAMEILRSRRDPLLKPFGPERFEPRSTSMRL